MGSGCVLSCPLVEVTTIQPLPARRASDLKDRDAAREEAHQEKCEDLVQSM